MKNFIILLSGLFLCVGICHVSYASDVGKHSGTKTELAYTLATANYDFVVVENTAAEFSFMYVMKITPSIVVEPLYSLAELVSDVGKEYDHGMYLPVAKSNYRSPHIDKDYKWKYSAWYNS